MKNDFLVSVRCMSYNHAPYIKDCMNGFTMQETNFPYVCVIDDDASTDGEPEAINAYLDENFNMDDKSVFRCEATDDYRLIFAQHKINRNCFFAVFFLKYNHYSIRKSKSYVAKFVEGTKYRAICEGDDYWIDPLKLQKQVDFMESHPDYSMVHTRFYYQEIEDGQLKEDSQDDIVIKDIINNNKDIAYNVLKNNKYRIQPMTVLYRHASYEKVCSYIENEKGLFAMGDTQLWLNLLQVGKIKYIPQLTSVYRLSSNSASRADNKEKRIRFALSCEEMRLYYSKKMKISDTVFYDYYRRALIKYLLFCPNYRSDERIVKYEEIDIITRLLIKSDIFRYLGWAQKYIN